MEAPRKQPSEVIYYFAWDHSGQLSETSEDKAISDGYKKYCRILLDGSNLGYRLFVPTKAGKQLKEVFFRKLVQWLRDHYQCEVRDKKGRLGNRNVDDAGRYVTEGL